MSKNKRMLLEFTVIIIIAFSSIIFFLISTSPNGYDVQNALKLQTQIKKIIVSSEYGIGSYFNVVMMKEKRKGLSVVIINPTPNPEIIFNLLNNNKDNIYGNNISIIFKDSQMKEIKRYLISK